MQKSLRDDLAGGAAAEIGRGEANEGAISGRVVDANIGLPLADVAIEVYRNDRLVAFALTAEDGTYTTPTTLTPGEHFALSRNALGYLDELYDGEDCVLHCFPSGGTPILVPAGQTVAGIDFALVKGGAIAGVIVDTGDGDPIPGVLIQVCNEANLYGTAMTDAAGQYSLGTGLPAGNYFAHTWNELGYIDELYDDVIGDHCLEIGGTPISVALDEVTTGIDFALDRGGAIGGRVTDALSGEPLFSIDVAIYDASGSVSANALSDLGGHYTTGGGLIPGNYYAIAAAFWGDRPPELFDDLHCDAQCDPTTGTPIIVAAGVTTTGVDFDLDLGGAIRGRLTDETTGEGIASISVVFRQSLGFGFFPYAVTDEQGFYNSGFLLRPDVYTVFTSNHGLGYADEFFDDVPCELGCDLSLATPVPVARATLTSGIDFDLVRTGGFSGLLAVTLPEGFADVLVDVYDQEGDWVSSNLHRAPGDYSSEPLPAGTYFAVASPFGFEAVLYDGLPCPPGCDVTSGTPITIESGVITPGIDFQIGPEVIFTDGFESGDLSAWSEPGPERP